MARRNVLTSSPPYAVEQAIRRLGAHLRTARLRRNLSIDNVAQKIGTGRRAAAKGKASTSAAVYMALLRACDLLTPMEMIADPASDPRRDRAVGAARARASKKAAGARQ